MTTAAKKFDLVPPWCVIDRRDDKSRSWGQWIVMSHDRSNLYQPVGFKTNGDEAYMTENEALDRARHYARLTRPLDSWEPGADCPLPVEGWHVREHPPLTGWYLYDGNEMDVGTGDNRQFPTRAAAIVWAWKEGPAPDNTIAGRITPEADAQTDRKGRTLVEIDAKIDRECARIHELVRGLRADVDHAQHTADHALSRIDAVSEGAQRDSQENRKDLADVSVAIAALKGTVQGMYDRVDAHGHKISGLDSLIAARVDRPATINTRSDDASTNDVMTEAAAVDDGWREMLVPVAIEGRYRAGQCVFWRTPDNSSETSWTCDEYAAKPGWDTPSTSYKPVPMHVVPQKFIDFRNRMAPPPNLAEWYKPKAAQTCKGDFGECKICGTIIHGTATSTGDGMAHAVCYRVREAVPGTFRDDDLAKSVRNLASAHEQALKVQEQYRDTLATCNEHMGTLRTQLAAANESARQAEGRAHTATKRASKAEEELADLRGKVENLRAAFSG